MQFISWPEIEGFHHIRKFLRVDPGEWWMKHQLFSGTSVVDYKCKVKLHGTNAGVQVHADGSIFPQSRTNLLTPESDNAGFARWVMGQQEAWAKVGARKLFDMTQGWVVFGEWCGPGIQKGVALSEIPKKVFAVFAAKPLGDSGKMVIEPEQLQQLVRDIPDVYVLPWYVIKDDSDRGWDYEARVDINYKSTDEQLSKSIAPINDWVQEIENNDPWVEETFGVKGTGEGLVFYPTSLKHLGWENFINLCFKAKGDAHKNIKTAAPVQVNPEIATSVDAFVELVLTQARLEQGATTVALSPGSYDQQQTGKFVQWIIGDVQKETQDELSASNLDWKQVLKPLQTKARLWYLTQARK